MSILTQTWLHFGGLALAVVLPAHVAAAELPSQAFRDQHKVLKEHLAHVDQAIGTLSGKAAAEQRKSMAFMIDFLQKHIAPHAAWEEKWLYPAVDRHAAKPGEPPMTATMRHEHRIIGRWIEDLERLAKGTDARAFARKADQLLGLVLAHFEEEEEVLLPVLDKALTREQFRKEVPLEEHEHGK